EASKVCGGTWLHTFRRVIFPLIMPALITVGLVGFISAARDISTVVLLGSGKSRTLSLLMLDFAAGAEFEKATVVAVIIVGLWSLPHCLRALSVVRSESASNSRGIRF